MILLIALMIPLTGCLVETFSGLSAGAELYRTYVDYKKSEKATGIVAPTLVSYSKELQEKAGKELKLLPQPCSRSTIRLPCSALSRMIMDYQHMRDQVRVLDASSPE